MHHAWNREQHWIELCSNLHYPIFSEWFNYYQYLLNSNLISFFFSVLSGFYPCIYPVWILASYSAVCSSFFVHGILAEIILWNWAFPGTFLTRNSWSLKKQKKRKIPSFLLLVFLTTSAFCVGEVPGCVQWHCFSRWGLFWDSGRICTPLVILDMNKINI